MYNCISMLNVVHNLRKYICVSVVYTGQFKGIGITLYRFSVDSTNFATAY